MLVRDVTDTRAPLNAPRPADLVVRTKVDLLPAGARPAGEGLGVSARTGEGIDELRGRLDTLAFAREAGGSGLALNVRHRQAIEQARESLRRAEQVAGAAGPEVVALELREALDALGQVLGQVTPDDVLGRVFATFCIGK